MEVPQGFFVLLVALLTPPEDSVVSASSAVLITPAKPLVQLGSSLSLNCSASCSPGKPRWDIMTDSTLANPDNYDQYSILKIPNVTVDDTSFSCAAKCGWKTAVKLYYFSALSITADPEEPVSGQQFQLKCTVQVHPAVEAELKLKREKTVMFTQTRCELCEDVRFKCCEVSVLTEATQLPYQCEATLQVESSHHTQTAELQLQLKEALSTKPPIKTTSPPVEPPSTAALDTERVPVQTERPLLQSTAAFKESAAVSKTSPVKATSSTAAGAETEAQASKSGQTVMVSVPVILVFVVILAALAGLFCFWKKRKCQEKPKGETPPP